MRIEHAAIFVSDLEAAKAFFVRYFGAAAGKKYHNRTTEFESYFLSFDDATRLEVMTRPNLLPLREGVLLGYAHLAFSVGSKEQVDALTAKLRDDGYSVLSGPRVTGDGYYESCIQIFDGIQLEITV